MFVQNCTVEEKIQEAEFCVPGIEITKYLMTKKTKNNMFKNIIKKMTCFAFLLEGKSEKNLHLINMVITNLLIHKEDFKNE